MFSALGTGGAGVVEEVQRAQVADLLSELYGPTIWDKREGMKEQESIIFLDLLQVLDGVLTGQLKNCLLDTAQRDIRQRLELETATVFVDAPGSQVRLEVRFTEHDIYVEYR